MGGAHDGGEDSRVVGVTHGRENSVWAVHSGVDDYQWRGGD